MNESSTPQRFLGLGTLLIFGGVFLVVASLSDLLSYPGRVLPLLTVRLVWAGTYLGLGLWARRASPSGLTWVSSLVTGLTPVFFAAFLWLSGGLHTGAFPWLLALPLLLVVFLRSTPAGAAVGSAVTAVVALALLTALGASAVELWQWGSSLVAAGVMSVYAAWHQGRLYTAIESTNRARLEALSQVVDSERRRAVNDRLVLVGQLAAGVAHEVNNPLAVVAANLGFLWESAAVGDDEVRQVLADTQMGVQRISSIVRALRAYSSESTNELMPIDCRQVLDQAARLAAVRARPDQLRCDFPAGLPRVMANETHLVQTLVGVVGNSLDATANETRPERWIIALKARVEQGRVLVTVEDGGPGFTPEALARAGTPFFTTKPPGSGLGLSLAVAREYVERMGGTITFANREGGGARVTIALVPAAGV